MRKLMLCATVLAGVVVLALSQAAVAMGSGGSSEFVVVYRDTATLQEGRQAVRAAGGTIVSENADIGVAKVRSRDARFIAKADAQRALDGAARNRAIGHSPGDDRPQRSEVEREEGGRFGHGHHRGSRLEPLSPLQWDMRMIGATPDGSYAVEQGSHKVEVGIIDTGVQGDHPDIKPNFDKKLSRNFAPDIPSIDGPCEEEPDHSCDDPADVDDGGHGTHVAGTVGAALNGVGIGGVAPRVDLVALTAGQDSGFFFLQPTVDALTFAADHGVDVVNMSFFIDPWLYNCVDNPFDTPTQQAEQRTIIEATNRALEYAHAHGVTMVAALGNENTDLGHPTIDHTSPDIQPGFVPQPPDFFPDRPVDNTCVDLPTEGPHVMAVSALGPSGRKAYYSNWGLEQTDVSAPGGDRREGFGTPQFNAPENRVLSSYPADVARAEGDIDENGDPTTPLVVKRCDKGRCAYWEWLQGTSMASPHAAGVAALIVSAFGVKDRAHGGLTMDPDRVEAILKDTATDTPCPAQEPFHYPDPDLGPEFDALCEGTPARNGFYGDGIVNALGAVQGAPR